LLRSIFIGFLILSTLSSKDIGAGVKQSFADIAADMLMEIFSASVSSQDIRQEEEVACTDIEKIRQDQLPAYLAASEGFTIFAAIEKNEAWLNPYSYRFESPDDIFLCNLTPLKEKIYIKEIISYGSDVSPPYKKLFSE